MKNFAVRGMNECEEVNLGCEEEKEKVAGKCRTK